jgi:hypothetical protein
MKNKLIKCLLSGLLFFSTAFTQDNVLITLDPDSVRYTLSVGIGGNFCFSFDNDVSRYNLENLHVASARTEMVLTEWEPWNDNDDPDNTNWDYFSARDQGEITRKFEWMQDFTERDIPYAIAIWNLPDWLDNGGKIVSRELWGELAESICSFLIYARDNYGTEPDYFSFNEPNGGVNVLWSDTEHRDIIKFLGERFVSSGLKTRWFLGDVWSPGPIDYTDVAAADTSALKYAGAISFHSWGVGTPGELGAWGDLSQGLGLPLWVGEAGVDAFAWQDQGKMHSYSYAMEEMDLYQRLFIYARPQAIQFWEYTPDYNLGGSGAARWNLMLHWAQFTPRGSEALTGVEVDDVLFSSFRHDGNQTITMHLANPVSTSKIVTIEGVPASVAILNSVRTEEGSLFQEQAPLTVTDGSVTVDLPGRSLTTLYGDYEFSSGLEEQQLWHREMEMVVRRRSAQIEILVSMARKNNYPVLEIYECNGRHIKTLKATAYGNFTYVFVWDTKPGREVVLKPGTYLASVRAGNNTCNKIFMLY